MVDFRNLRCPTVYVTDETEKKPAVEADGVSPRACSSRDGDMDPAYQAARYLKRWSEQMAWTKGRRGPASPRLLTHPARPMGSMPYGPHG